MGFRQGGQTTRVARKERMSEEERRESWGGWKLRGKERKMNEALQYASTYARRGVV